MHISVDDVAGWLREATESGNSSVWRHPAFSFLRRMHVAYGAVFSLYPFVQHDGWDLDRMSTAFRDEFREAAPWLRFGFHALDAATDYGRDAIPAEAAAEHYARTVNAVLRFAGPASLDRVPRTHFYAGRAEHVRAWRDAPHGIVGLMAPEDGRTPYHLTESQRDAVAARGVLYDEAERLSLVRTDLRLEHHDDPVARLAALAERGTGDGGSTSSEASGPDDGRTSSLAVFTHEQEFDVAMREKVQAVCAWAREHGYAFAFPMDRIRER